MGVVKFLYLSLLDIVKLCKDGNAEHFECTETTQDTDLTAPGPFMALKVSRSSCCRSGWNDEIL